MVFVLNTIADYLVQQSIQISVVIALVWAATWGLRKASAHLRYLLWLVVIAKCLTPPLLSLPLPIFPQDESKQGDASVASVSTLGAEFESRMVGVSQPSEPPTRRQQASAVPVREQNAISPVGKHISRSAALHSISGRAWLVMTWILVVGVLLAYTFAKAWAHHRRLKRTRLPVDVETRIAFDALVKRLEMSVSPSVYAAAPVAQPFVWGWIRGDVYLPLRFVETGNAEQRKAILTHELAHVARWDAAANLVQHIAQAIFFFHPLIWWANQRIRHEREKCCDEIVLSGLGTRPQVYCEAIVEMLTCECEASHFTPALAVAGSMKSIEDRFTTILTPNREFRRRPSLIAVAALVLVATCVLPTAIVLTTRADTPNTADRVETADPPKAESDPEKRDPEKRDPEKRDPEKNGAEKKDTVKNNAVNNWQAGQVMDFRVINAETKEPIPGVNLELQNMGKGIDFQDVKVQTTDAAGRSLIRLPDLPPTAVRVYPSKEGFVPLRVYWASEPSPVMPQSITIPMEPGKKFGGTICNESGEPIPGVAITIHYWGPGKGKNPHVRANVCPENFTCKGQTTSDMQGRWHIDVMPAEIAENDLRIYLHHPDYVSDHLKRAIIPIPVAERPSIEKLFDQTAVMVMREGETIHGRVVDQDGRPIPNATIYDSEYYWFRPGKPRARTNGEGAFRISGVKPSSVEDRGPRFDRHSGLKLTVQATGYAPELIEVRGSSTPLTIQLKPGQTVRGRVVDSHGKPLQGVSVSARRWREYSNRLHLASKSDADGSFRLTDAPTDSVGYDFGKEGYMRVDVFGMSPSTNEYSVTLKAPVRITGSVVDAATGKPLDKFTFIRGIDYDDGRAPWWSRSQMKTITNGRYETAIVQEGFLYRVRVEANGYMPGESRLFRPYDPDKGEVTYDFKLSKAAPLTGTVLGLNGEPLADARVFLARQRMNLNERNVSSVNPMDSVPVKTDMAGRFEFPAEVEPFCLVVVHEHGVAMITEEAFEMQPRISIQPWTDKNQRLQIIRRPAPGQHVDFPARAH